MFKLFIKKSCSSCFLHFLFLPLIELLSQLRGVVHAVVLLLIFIFLMPLINYVPMACLAAVLVMVSYNMSGWRTIVGIMKNPKSDISVMIVTFLLTVVFDLTIAIEIGLLLAMVLFLQIGRAHV